MNLLRKILTFYVFYSKVNGQQYPCIAADGSLGTCKSLYSCQPLLAIANNPYGSLLAFNLLRVSYCGFDTSGWAAVCCPGQRVYIPDFTTSSQCFTPEGKPGQCVSLQHCPRLANLVRPQYETVKYLQRSRCTNGPDGYSVCCDTIPSWHVGKKVPAPESTLSVYKEETLEPSLSVYKEKTLEPSLPVYKEETPERSFPADKELTPEPSLPANKDVTPEPTLSVNKEETPEPSLPADKEVTPEPSLPADKDVTPEPTLSVNKEETPEPSLPADKEVTPEPSLPADKEVTPEPTLSGNKEVTTEPSLSVDKEETPEPSLPVVKEVTPEPSLSADKEVTPEPSFPVDNEVVPEPNLTGDKKVTPEPSLPVDKEMTPEPNLSVDKDVSPWKRGKCASSVSSYPPDPKTECCGIDASAGNKIVGGVQNAIDEHPWLLVIEYNEDALIKVMCSGVLISGKYVLTAAHCVTGPVLKLATPKNILLGEYDISHEGIDCVPVEDDGEDCTDGVTRIAIEKTIPHPEYNPANPQRRHDIALIRMAEMAPYTDFIRPICLPKEDVTMKTEAFNLIAAGWGSINTGPNGTSKTSVKSDVQLPFINLTECQESYRAPRRNVTLWKGHFCAGGDMGKDSCKGDSGGPLMYENSKRYEVNGIISFGPVPCGIEGVPAVYTNVYEYDSWIRNNINP